MPDLYTCPRCPGTDPEWEELWVAFAVDAAFDPDAPVSADHAVTSRWKITCATGHVLLVSDDVREGDLEEHAPPTADELATVGAIPWQYENLTLVRCARA